MHPGPPPLWGREGVTLANSTECLIQMISKKPIFFQKEHLLVRSGTDYYKPQDLAGLFV